MNSKIQSKVSDSFGGTIPATLGDIIDAMVAEKNLGNKVMDKVQAQFPELSDGLYMTIKKAIQAERALDSQPSLSPQEARIDRILNIRNSDGRVISRRW